MSNAPTQPVTSQPGAELARALVAAQASIRAIPHDARNQYHHYSYASAEAIITECKAALTANGLSLMPAGQSLQFLEGQTLLVRQFVLLHTGGEERSLTTAWPIVPDKGRPVDKATACAATTSLAYLLRDLLLAPRVDPADDLAGREDRPEPPPRKEKPKAIGPEGAQKLLLMISRKGVTHVDTYLAAAGVAPGQPLNELAPEQARTIWKQLQALPDATATPDAALPATSAPPATNNQPTPHGKSTGRVEVPF
jgi:hypothetical protein